MKTYTQEQLNQLSVRKYNKLYNQLTFIQKKLLTQ